MDDSGNIYTTKYKNSNVSKIAPDGTSTILGTTGTNPKGIVVDATGNIYTANYGSDTVTKITPDGTSTILGTT
jgi:streptogramin lyase